MTRSIAVLTTCLALSAVAPRVVAADAGRPSEKAAEAARAAGEAASEAAETAGEVAETVGEETKEAALDFADDMWGMPSRLWQDIRALPDRKNAITLAIGGGLAFAANEEWDARVRSHTERHPRRFGKEWNDALDALASGYTLYGLSAAFYGSSLFIENRRLHDFSLDLVSALTIGFPVVYGLKKAFHTERPNGDPDGFPSGHTAAATSLAALANRHYGPWAGAAGAGLAALVAFHRIDARDHDLSDVIFGAAIGYVAGRTAGEVDEKVPVLGARVEPLQSRGSARGLQLAWSF